MSTHQQSKFFRAKKYIAEESARPGTCRSKVGCAAIDEPWTNRMVPAVLAGSPAHFSNRNSFAAPPSLVVQCSSALMAAADVATSFIVHLIDQRNVVGRDDLSPFGDFHRHESGEFGLRHHHGDGTLRLPGGFDVGAFEDRGDRAVELVDDRL